MPIEPRYHKQETAKEYTKQYDLQKIDSIVTKQEDGLLGYISSGQFATTGSNIFTDGQIVIGNLTIAGDIFANTFNVSTTSIEHFTASTRFGLDNGDTHTFTGSVFITGSQSLKGDLMVSGSMEISQGIHNWTFGSDGIIKLNNGYGEIYAAGDDNYVRIGTAAENMAPNAQIIIGGPSDIFKIKSGPPLREWTFEGNGDFNLSGSINGASNLVTTGSNTFIGNQTLTGSFLVSGSTTQIGNNTLKGNTILSGSIDVSGSLNLYGSTNFNNHNTKITGSLLISGSTTQIGNNTLTGNTILSGSVNISGSTSISGTFSLTGSNTIGGNTIMYGSLEVSGSTNFHNHTIIMTGSMFTSGSQIITGSLDIKGNLNVASGSEFYLAGNKLFNYGQFYDTTTQSGSANTAYPIKLNTADLSHNVSVVSGSRLTVVNTGIYNIQFSTQLHTTQNEACDFSIWFLQTGSAIANSNTDFSIEKVSGGGFSVAALNFLTPIQSGSYIELYWSNTTGHGQLQYKGTQSTPNRPGTPSVIVTLTQIG